MKKFRSLFTAGLVLFAFVFTSCEDDEVSSPPLVLTTSGGEIVLAEGVGDYTLEGSVQSEAGVAEVRLLEVTDDGNFQIGGALTSFDDPGLVSFSFAITGITDTMVVRVEAIDVEFHASYSDDITFIYTPVEETPLTEAVAATWERVGGAAGTGLDMFGLKWTDNLKTVKAVIEKDGAGKLVQLTGEHWDTVETVEALAAAVGEFDGIDDYRGVSAMESDTYNDILATKVGDDYYLIRVIDAVVTSAGDGSTSVTINIEYKSAVEDGEGAVE